MASTRRVGSILTAILAAALLFTFLAVPAARADAAPSGVAQAVTRTHETVSARLGDDMSAMCEKLGEIKDALMQKHEQGKEQHEQLQSYGKDVAKDMTAATDEFVAMLEGIGDSFDNGDLEGMKNTPKTFVDGLGTYLGAIKDAVKP